MHVKRWASELNGRVNEWVKEGKKKLVMYIRSCSIGTNRVGLVGLVEIFTRSIGNQPFSVGSVGQPNQPALDTVDSVENDG